MKRPEIERYVAPALRGKFNEYFEEKMADVPDIYASEAPNRQNNYLEYRDSSRGTSNIVPGKVRYNSSSSSNPRNTSDESNKDEDSSDLEDGSSIPTQSMSDEEISTGTNEKNSDEDWKKARRGKPTKNNLDIEPESYETNTKIPNRVLMEHEDDSDLESHANQLRAFKSNGSKHDRRLSYNSDESIISDIEAIIDDHMKMDRLLTSTPYSDIEDQNVIDAAKFDLEEEDGPESTLLSQSESTINTNRNKCGYNFEIYQDPSSVTNLSRDFAAMFGNNYIPPPVPRPTGVFQLPLIHRLPIRTSPQIVLSVPGQGSSQKRPQLPTQMGNPRSQNPSSIQLCSHLHSPSFIPPKSSLISPIPRYGLSPRLQLEPSRVSNPSYIPSPIPPISPQERINLPRPHDTPSRTSNSPDMSSAIPPIFSPQERINTPRNPQDAPFRTSNSPYMSSIPPILSPQERINTPRPPQDAPSSTSNSPYMSSIPPILSPQERINPPRTPQDTSNSPPYFIQRPLNSQGLESNEQEDFFYIPPPVPPPQQMTRMQLLRNFLERQNVKSCQPSSISSVNKNVYDGKI